MSRQEPKKKAIPSPAKPAESGTGIPRSGAGAGTAFAAMLRKRQMRAADAEPEAQPPVSLKKKANE